MHDADDWCVCLCCYEQPSTELEKEVAAVLATSENVEQELTEVEKKSLFKMTVEEVISVSARCCFSFKVSHFVS